MRSVEISNKQIIEAGEALQEDGREVTAFGLRTKIGGGNAKRLWEVWNHHVVEAGTTHGETPVPLPAEVEQSFQLLSTALVTMLKRAAMELNSLAVRTSEQRIVEALRQTGEQSEKSARDMSEAAQAVDALELELETSHGACVELEIKIVKLTEELSSAQHEGARLRGQLEATKEQQAAILCELQRWKAAEDGKAFGN